jgi:hypothetical protein
MWPDRRTESESCRFDKSRYFPIFNVLSMP